MIEIRRPMPSMEILREYFEYHGDGFFVRLKRAGRGGRGNAGDEARGTKTLQGYRKMKFQGRLFLLHRLVWQFNHGNCPEYLDHINRNPSDNRIENLRAATSTQNHFNRGLDKNNSSGTNGLSFDRRRKAWRGQVRLNGKTIYAGRSPDKETARLKLVAFQKLHHGEFYAGD